MAEHLTALDATFLELEQADDSAHMHIGAIMVFDPPPAGALPTRDELCQHLRARLRALPRYEQRLSQPHTGGLAWPEWIEDEAFELARHVSRAALPSPGGDAELREWSSAFFSQRLDRHRPLWEMVIVEGLAGGRWALATKTHHCMVDGVGSVDVGHLLLDIAPQPRGGGGAAPGEPRRASGARGDDGGPLARLARAWAGALPGETFKHAAEAGAHGLEAASHGLLHPRDALRAARDGLRMIVEDELHAAPRTSLNRRIGAQRRFEVVQIPLAHMQEIKNALGGTLNDVALALTAAGLRELLLSRREPLPEQGLRAMVPVNLRVASERLALGNRITSLFVDLPVVADDAGRRYRETAERTHALKADESHAAGTAAVIEMTALAPPVVHATLAQALYSTRLFNLTITNVPGPQQTLYAFGAALREIHPLVPLAAAHALGVALVSYDGNVFFGVIADRDSVPDLEVMLEAVRTAAGELLALARSPAAGAAHAVSKRRDTRAAAGAA